MINTALVPATDLERETGLGKDLLRKWRSRYGFPVPTSRNGRIRGYPKEQVDQLRLIRHLQDAGFRPAQIVGKPLVELEQLCTTLGAADGRAGWSPLTRKVIDLLLRHELQALENLLDDTRKRQSLTEFACQTLAPLADALGEGWARNEISVYQEHLCTGILVRLLYAGISAAPAVAGRPRIIFATPGEELHILGLLMAQAVLADQGAHCISIGPQIPVEELASAASSCAADIVALSFSCAYPKRRIRPLLSQLRRLLPPRMEIWAGGGGTACIRRASKGIRIFAELPRAVTALDDYAMKAQA